MTLYTISHELSPIYSTITDPEMVELVEMFVGDAPGKASTLASAFEERSWGQVRQLAHQLKGSAAGYGFECLTDTAGQLEMLLHEKVDAEQIATSVSNLIQMLQRLRVA